MVLDIVKTENNSFFCMLWIIDKLRYLSISIVDTSQQFNEKLN